LSGQCKNIFTPIWEEILCREERCYVLGKVREKSEVVDEEKDKNAI
jgi:hypothetical protein